MKNNLIQTILFVFSLTLTNNLQAQDLQFSNYETFFSAFNPSMTGYIPNDDDLRTAVIYRNQWSSVLGINSYNTYGLTFDIRNCITKNNSNHFNGKGSKFKNATWGLGVTLLHDESGTASINSNSTNRGFPLSRDQIIGTASLHKPLDDRTFINFGFKVAGTLQRIRTEDLTFDEQFDGLAGFDSSTTGEFSNIDELNNDILDFGVGLSFSHLEKRWGAILGGAVDHILTPSEFDFIEGNDEVNLSRRFAGHVKISTILHRNRGKNFGLNFNALILHQNAFQQISGGAALFYQDSYLSGKSFTVSSGVNIRSSRTVTGKNIDALVAAVSFNFENISIGFNYDLNVSKLSVASNSYGAFELSMIYRWKKRKSECRPTPFGCPDGDVTHAIFF